MCAAAAVPFARPLDPAALLTGAVDDLRQRPMAHLGAQLGFLLPLAGWFVVAQVVTNLLMLGATLVLVAGSAAGAYLDVALHHREATFAWLGLFFAGFVGQLGLYGGLGAMAVALVILVTVLRLGLHRDLARQDDGGPPMGVAASFRNPFWRFGTVLLVGLLSPVLISLWPVALVLGLFGVFHAPTMAIRRVGSFGAVRLQVAALTRDPGRFLLLGFLSAVLTGLCCSVPVVGPALALAFQHRAARDVLAV